MAVNTNPVFAKGGAQQWSNVDGDGGAAGSLKTQNTALDGTGTLLTVFTAGADGAWVEELLFAASGTNIQTVARVWLADAAGTAVADAVMIAQATLPATTAAANAATPVYRIPIRMAIPATYRLRVALGTTVAGGYWVSANASTYTA